MGLFKTIKKGFKSVFKGIKKVFKGAAKLIGKVMGNKWVKRLMIAAAIVTGGIAIMSGVGGFMSGTGFFGRFISGGEAFLKGLTSPISSLKGGLAGAKAAAGQGAGAVLGGAAKGAAQAAGVGPATVMAAGQKGISSSVAGATPAAAKGGFLSKAGGVAKDFVTSPGGGLVTYGAMQGYAQGKAAEVEREQREESLADFNTPDALAMFQQQGEEAGDVMLQAGGNIRNRFDAVRQRALSNTMAQEERYV